MRKLSPRIEEIDCMNPSEYKIDGSYLKSSIAEECKRDFKVPKLSSHFLRRNVNARQRNIIVGFLIRTSINYDCLI